MILYGDARDIPLDDNSVQTIVTSPPYYSLRSYGDSDLEIGRGSVEQYVTDMHQVSRELWRVLDPEGVLWLNIGDTAAGSGGAGGDYNSGGRKQGQPRYRQKGSGLKPMQWCLIPSRVALEFQYSGWLVRSWITWDKGRQRPESLAHVRRPRPSSEVLLMLVKQKKYRFFPEGLEEEGDVWHFPPYRGKRGHLAPFPPELPRRCILASTSPGDTVFDPFVGSGTTVQVAEELGRTGIGLDLYEFDP